MDDSHSGSPRTLRGITASASSRALRHCAWADAKLFDALATLPEAALDARYAPTAWSVRQLAVHIVEGAEWYAYCLRGRPWTDMQAPRDHADLRMLAERLAALNALLLEEGDLPDDRVTFDDEDGPRTVMRSTLLAQACLHSIEHRTQIACALEVSGIGGVVLDDYDLWAFEVHERI